MIEDQHIELAPTGNGDSVYVLRQSAIRRHVYLIGKTGTGKSTLLKSMMLQDYNRNQGFALLDPHGDLAEEIADCAPHHRENHIIYFDPSDLSHPIGFNPLQNIPFDKRDLVAEQVVTAFKHIWHDSWGERLEYILKHSVRLLLEKPDSTLLGLPRLLINDQYRRHLLTHCKDQVTRNFWIDEFDNYSAAFRKEAIAPIQNKVGKLLAPPALRYVLGQPRSGINIRKCMDNGGILIANLSKGRLGENVTKLIGALIATSFAQAAESRADIPKDQRRDFTLYVDEFQNFATDSFASVLSEARKYRLALVLAHQFIGQIDDKSKLLRQAVIGNVGTMMAFRIGADDAHTVAAELGMGRSQELTTTSDFKAWVRLSKGGTPLPPQHLEFPLPEPERTGRLPHVRARAYARHGRPRASVEARIDKFHQS